MIEQDHGYGDGQTWIPLTPEELKNIDDQIYTPFELQRLDQFHHIHAQIDHVLDQADKPHPIGWFNKVSKDGKAESRDLVFMMDINLVRTMQYIALHMYEEFRGVEKMKEVADDTLHTRHDDKRMAREFQNLEFDSWYDGS